MGILDAALNFGAKAVQLGEGAQKRSSAAQTPQAGTEKPAGAMAEDPVTLAERQNKSDKVKDLPIQDYRHSVANDSRFVKETLGTKLSELDVSLDTKVSIKKSPAGGIEVDAKVPEEKRQRIESDLNQNRHFKAAFDRLSVNQPTLDYLDNVTKLSQAYGTSNSLVESLVSEREDNNNLQDIAHRYQQMQKQMAAESEQLSGERQNYEIRFNASA